VQRVQLLLRPGAGTDGAVLVRRVTRNVLAPVEEPQEEEIICRSITAFTIRYYDGLQWADTWDSAINGNTLPMAYEVTLEVAGPVDTTVAAGEGNLTTYRTTRSFFAPCRDEAALESLGGIR
jgi:hypothetical protein